MPRPLMFDAAATETIKVRVTPEQKRDLARIADANQTDLAGVIREAVNEYVADFRDQPCFVAQNVHVALP